MTGLKARRYEEQGRKAKEPARRRRYKGQRQRKEQTEDDGAEARRYEKRSAARERVRVASLKR